MKYSQKNPRTESFYWTGTVIGIGHQEHIEEGARNARLQVTEADGKVSFIPIVQREDPDLTVYENISQILLTEDLEKQTSRKKIKLVTSSQESNSQNVPVEVNDENCNENDESYLTLNPDEVEDYLNQAEKPSNPLKASEEGDCLLNNESGDVNCSGNLQKDGNKKFEQPKDSSTPANRKLKRARVINPDDLTDMEVKRADLEASNSIKQAADKIMEAATMIINCMQELKPEIKALSNRNYREIQMSTSAVKQLVSNKIFSCLLL